MSGATSKGPSGPKLSAMAALKGWRRDPLGLLERAATYGDVVRTRFPGTEAWLLNHPDQVRDVLVSGHHDFMKGPTIQAAKRVLGENLLTGEGEFHRRQRRLIQPIFHHQRIEGYARIMAEHAQRDASRWQPGVAIDMHAEMARLTLSVVGKALFDADVETEEAKAIGQALTVTLSNFPRVFSPLFRIAVRLPLPSNLRLRRAQALLDSTIYRMIEQRRAAGADGTDLLSLMLAAREGEDGRMNDKEVRDEAMTLFLAGHETTAVALTWTWHLLAGHPEVEQKLHAELDEVLQGRLPGSDDLSRLPYTQMVLREAMRVYPPAWAIGRRTLGEHPVDGFVIPAGAVVVVSPYLVHRDPRWWPDPLAFLPERWGAEDPARPRLAYFPFGGGPRMCIGEPFAWMEAAVVVATIAQRWRFASVPGLQVRPRPAITLRPDGGLPMIPERRAE
jgi:cytochrome P450